MGQDHLNGGGLPSIYELQKEQTEKLSDLEKILDKGFASVRVAIETLTKEAGMIRETLVNALTSVVGQVIKTLCWVFMVIIIWVTGLKALSQYLGLPT
jgi:hypothetical protein